MRTRATTGPSSWVILMPIASFRPPQPGPFTNKGVGRTPRLPVRKPNSGLRVYPGRGVSCPGAADVDPVPADPARGSVRRRGAVAPAARAGRLHPPCRAGRVHLAAARVDRLPQRREHRPRGDGRGRVPGGALPGAAAAGAVRDLEPLDRVRRQPVPAQGPPRQRLPPRPDARGDVHAAREGSLLVVPRPAAAHLPDPDQVPRRGATRAPGCCAAASS